jgi:integrase
MGYLSGAFPMPKLTRKLIETLQPADAEFCVWDTRLTGFGVRVRPTGGRSYVLFYRLGGRFRKLTLGKADGGYGLDEARDRAVEKLRDVRDGVDPQARKVADRNALTVAELTDLYLKEGPVLKPNKKATSWETNRTMFDCHIKPLVGRRLARDITPMDVSRMQLDISLGKTARNVMIGPRRRSRVVGGKRVAAMAVITLGAVYEFAIREEYLQKNPTKGVERFPTVRRERYLSEREIAAISEALTEFERKDRRYSVMADSVRLLMLTGCRKTEILSLQWDFVDWHKSCLRLPESKTGAKVVPLADDAVAVLKRRWDETRPPGSSQDHNSGEVAGAVIVNSPWVLPALRGDGHFVGLAHLWTRVKTRADLILQQRVAEMGGDLREVRSLANVRLHDLRHSFASFAIADGASLFVVGKVLGHKQARTTEIYAHLSDDPLKLVANRTAARLAQAMRF